MAEIQLNELLNKIKKDGIAEAEKEAAKILSEAREKAEIIIKDAERGIEERRKLLEQEIVNREASSKAALVQASRDVCLRVEAQLKTIFNTVVSEVVHAEYSSEVVQKSLSSVFADDNISALELGSEYGEAMLTSVKAKFADKVKAGLQIQMSQRMKTGFILTEKDGIAYYDFSQEALADTLSEYVNSFVKGILQKSV